MSGDLPIQGLMQQMHAHSHSGEYLEVLGKRAAAGWSAGEHKTLTDAVTATVKQAQLSPEQVKRVVEFANTSAYLDEFKKEGAPHHVVDFPGGPADPSEILKDLNDGGGGSVFDRGTGDYDTPPAEPKISSSKAEEELFQLLAKTASPTDLPYENPHSEVIELKDKLAGAIDHLQSEISGLEVMYAELGDRVYHRVKQAALSGVSLGEVMQAWQSAAPSEDHIKVAFTLITPRLLRDGVFQGVEQMTESVDKVAGAKLVNSEHPLVVEFGEFCEALSKLAEVREARTELRGHLTTLNNYLKTASTAGNIYRGVKGVSSAAADAAAPFVSRHLGEGVGSLTHVAIKYSPDAAALIAANEARQHIENSPNPAARAVRGTGRLISQQIPGTQANLMHKYEIQSGQ